MATKTPRTKASAASGEARTVTLQGEPGKTSERMLAEAAVGGIFGNASTAHLYAIGTFRNLLDVGECIDALRSVVVGVQAGDLRKAEAMMVSQAVALDAIFGELARRAALNMGQHLDATERYMRLALKSQGQCRATLETLAAIKNPPVVFARQANINNGGQQQVNNGGPPEAARAQAANLSTEKTELLEASNGKRLDTGTARAASGADPHLEAVGASHRPTHR